MEVITMESSAFKMLTEQIADVAKLVALIYSNARENTKRRSMELVLTSSDAAKMLGVSKRTLQRMRSENRIDFIKIGNQCRYSINAVQKLIEERTIAKET